MKTARVCDPLPSESSNDIGRDRHRASDFSSGSAASKSAILQPMQWLSRFWLAAWILAGACAAPPSSSPVPEEKAPEKVVAAVHTEAEEQHSCGMQGHSCGADAPAPAAAEVSANGLWRIGERSAVCMLSNRYLGERADVPIEVEGKTYRGCCANCAARLGSLAEARMAKDPVTGHAVDKGSAVLARDANNRLYYFESEATFASYKAN